MKSSGKPFFLTFALEKSFEMVLLAVSQRWPVLLYGPTGAGKTALFNKLAKDYGNRGTYVSPLFSVLCDCLVPSFRKCNTIFIPTLDLCDNSHLTNSQLEGNDILRPHVLML